MEQKNHIHYLRLLLLFAITGFVLLTSEALGQKNVLTLKPGESRVVSTQQSVTAAVYQWYRNGNPIPGATSATYKIDQPGNYTVRAFNHELCPSELSDAIIVAMSTAVDLVVTKQSETRQVRHGEPFEYLLTVTNKGPNQATNVQLKDALPDGLEFIEVKSASVGIPQYDANARVLTWTIGTINVNAPVELRLLVKASQYGAVTNSATVESTEDDADMSNNKSSDTKQILGLDIPNVFTPNGDGKNDTFIVPDLSNFTENEIIIVNRWGNSVYEKKNYHNEWTGEGLNEGTYFYVLKVKNSKGNWDAYKGYVTLLRSK